jgi:hypothetical protein
MDVPIQDNGCRSSRNRCLVFVRQVGLPRGYRSYDNDIDIAGIEGYRVFLGVS